METRDSTRRGSLDPCLGCEFCSGRAKPEFRTPMRFLELIGAANSFYLVACIGLNGLTVLAATLTLPLSSLTMPVMMSCMSGFACL